MPAEELSRGDAATAAADFEFLLPTLRCYVEAVKDKGLQIVLYFFGIIALYVLSMGPMAELDYKGIVSDHVVSIIYLPLEHLLKTPVVGWLLNRYLDWWVPGRV